MSRSSDSIYRDRSYRRTRGRTAHRPNERAARAHARAPKTRTRYRKPPRRYTYIYCAHANLAKEPLIETNAVGPLEASISPLIYDPFRLYLAQQIPFAAYALYDQRRYRNAKYRAGSCPHAIAKTSFGKMIHAFLQHFRLNQFARLLLFILLFL